MDGNRVVVLGLFAPGLVEAEAEARPVQPQAKPAQPPDDDKPPVYEIDTASHFYNDEGYADRDELINWAREIGQKLKFAVVIGKSDRGGDRRKPFFRLDCERGGQYVSTKKKLKTEETGTRKCGCPFRLRGYFHADKKWYLTVVSGMHNHELDSEMEGHLIVGRLKPEERQLMEELSRNLVPPKNIISTLKERDSKNTTTSKQVYNARSRFKAKLRASMTEMQHLSKRLAENGYFFKFRTTVENGSEHVQDVFFAHPKSIRLFNSFHYVLLMDSTYKTNKYNMALFEIVGFTSTGKTFNVAFAWVTHEREDHFTWALQQCVGLLKSEDVRPKVIVTDRDPALMSAVAEVFPMSAAMVCSFHIEKNVSTRMKETVNVKNGADVKQSDVWDNIMNAFKDLLASPTETDYVESVMQFRKICAKWPKFLRYVEQTVLDTDKEKVVRYWVDQHMHMGNYTTNRAETSHGVLKGFLTDGNGDLVKGWEAINKMLIVQFTNVQAEFGQSMSVAEHRYGENPLYSFLFHKISRYAMDLIYTEAKRVEHCGMDSKKCGCYMRRTYGLPCACLIAKKIKNKRHIRLDEIHPQWKKLCFEDEDVAGDEGDDYSCLSEWKAIQERLKSSDVIVKNDIRNQLRLIAYPETTSVKPPLENAKTKGAPKKRKVVRAAKSTSRDKSRWERVDDSVAATQASQSKPSASGTKPTASQTTPTVPKEVSEEVPKEVCTEVSKEVSTELVIGDLTPATSEIPYIQHMPSFMRPFIERITDVVGDGYCGYRVVALYNKGNEEDYELTRMSMKRELSLNAKLYEDLFGGKDRLKFITNALFPPLRKTRRAAAPLDKWFTFPDMGFVVATMLQRVVVQLSTMERCGASKTCFPLRGSPPSYLTSKVCCIGALPDHFVLVELKEGCPLPSTAHGWREHCTEDAAAWESLLLERQQMFENLLAIERGDIEAATGKGSKEDPLEC